MYDKRAETRAAKLGILDKIQALEKELLDKFSDYSADKLRKPWQKYSAATGIADYKPGDSVDDVFARADEIMYKNKEKIKI